MRNTCARIGKRLIRSGNRTRRIDAQGVRGTKKERPPWKIECCEGAVPFAHETVDTWEAFNVVVILVQARDHPSRIDAQAMDDMSRTGRINEGECAIEITQEAMPHMAGVCEISRDRTRRLILVGSV